MKFAVVKQGNADCYDEEEGQSKRFRGACENVEWQQNKIGAVVVDKLLNPMQKLLNTCCVLFQLRTLNNCLVKIPIDVLLTFFMIFALILLVLVFIFLAGRPLVIFPDVDLFLAKSHDDEDREEEEVDEKNH